MSDRDLLHLKNWIKFWPIIVVIISAAVSFGMVKANINNLQRDIEIKANKTEIDVKCKAIQEKTEANIKTVDEKLNLIIDNQKELIKRFDRHIDKDNH